MNVRELMETYRPGSHDWSWGEEFAEIDKRLLGDPSSDFPTCSGPPILLGKDGRVLDGHHRIRLAVAVGFEGELATLVHEGG